MQEKSPIKKNILKFIDYKGISKYEFYKITGITRGVLDQNNGMSEENTARFLVCFPEVNAEWLILSKGEMLFAEEKKENLTLVSEPSVEYSKPCQNCEMMRNYIKLLEEKIAGYEGRAKTA